MKISGLTITTAVAMYAAASPAKALTLTMACEGYNVVFSPGSLMSHAPKKDRDYSITKVDVQNDRIVVTVGNEVWQNYSLLFQRWPSKHRLDK